MCLSKTLNCNNKCQCDKIKVLKEREKCQFVTAISIPSLESVSSSDGGPDDEELQEEEGSEVSSKGQESTSEDESEVECDQTSG